LPDSQLFKQLLIAAAQAQTLDPAKIKSRDVVYVPYKKLKAFPLPILEYQNDKPQYEKLKKHVVERIIYPMLCESAEPIAIITVDFCPDIPVVGQESKRGCKDEANDKLTIEVAIMRQGVGGFLTLIETDLNGNFEDDAYLTLFASGYGDYVPRNKGCKARKREGYK